MGYKLERKVKQTKAVSMWYSQPKRPNFQLKSPVEKKDPKHDGISVGRKWSLQLRATNCKR